MQLKMTQQTASNRDLCEQLIHADTEEEVVGILRAVNYWDDDSAWKPFGDNPANASIIGAQQESREAALIEKIVNSIDARFMDECKKRGIEPDSPDAPASSQEAIKNWLLDPHALKQYSKNCDIAGWERSTIDQHAEKIAVVATGHTFQNGYASISIIDEGEGQSPNNFPNTFCSLNTGNKRSVRFVQGKHTMGGTGVFRFCGGDNIDANNLNLIVSRQNPAHAPDGQQSPWGYTVIRKKPPTGNERTATYCYLAPDNQILSFHADSLPLMPLYNSTTSRALPYTRHIKYGTLTKLYEYIKTGYITKASQANRLTLLRELELGLTNPLLPIKIYECRAEIQKTSETVPTVVLTGISNRLRLSSQAKGELAWDGHPKSISFKVRGQPLEAIIWAFKEPAQRWRHSRGVLFVLNGQTHAYQPDSFFDKDPLKLNSLKKSLLVIVDCTGLPYTYESQLFMNNRERASKSVFAQEVLDRLAEELSNHRTLKELNNERGRFGGTEDEHTRQQVQTFFEKFMSHNPDLGKYLVDGTQITNPHKPYAHNSDVLVLNKFPTFCNLRAGKNNKLEKSVKIADNYFRIILETDVEDGYFTRLDAPGTLFVDICEHEDGDYQSADPLVRSKTLSDGIIELRLQLPTAAKIDDQYKYRLTLTDEHHSKNYYENFLTITVVKGKTPPSKPSSSKPKPKPYKGDVPIIKNVYEKDWPTQAPEPFTNITALRKVDTDADSNAYELRCNLDNKWLQNANKQSKEPQHAKEQRRRAFSTVNALIALAVIADDTSSQPILSDDDLDGISLNEKIDWVTALTAPIVASLVDVVSSPAAD